MKKQKDMSAETAYRLFIYVALITLAISIIIPVAWVFLASDEAKFGILWQPLGHAERFLFSKLHRCFPKGKYGYLYVEFGHGDCLGAAHFIGRRLAGSLCVGKIYL